MENNPSNYDMFDKLIENNKKGKSWTAFWMIALCLMAGAILLLAYTVSEKNNIIINQGQIIETSSLDLETKSRIIDSLVENCNDSKAAIVRDFDSAITQTQITLSYIVSTDANSTQASQISAAQKVQLQKASASIQQVKNDLYQVTREIRKDNTKLFVQYNNPSDAMQIDRMLGILKTKTEYVLAPPELIDNNFKTIIKFYNYKNSNEENLLKKLITEIFGINSRDILITYEKNSKIKTLVELWIGTRSPKIDTRQIQTTKPIQLQQKTIRRNGQ